MGSHALAVPDPLADGSRRDEQARTRERARAGDRAPGTRQPGQPDGGMWQTGATRSTHACDHFPFPGGCV